MIYNKTKSSDLTNDRNRPSCINYGCKRLVTNDGVRYRAVCSHCYNAGRGAGNYAPGVTPFRTGTCSNTDGHLGFPCPTNWEIMNEHFSGMIRTHVDHIDGNHWNNTLSNVEELCPLCHDKKGEMNGDKSGFKY